MRYQVESKQVQGGSHKSQEAAITEAQDLATQGYDAQVVAIETSGDYNSRTVVYPVRGETRTA